MDQKSEGWGVSGEKKGEGKCLKKKKKEWKERVCAHRGGGGEQFGVHSEVKKPARISC